MPESPAYSGNATVLDRAHPIAPRMRQVTNAWIGSGRGADWLIDGKALFLGYCWSLKYKVSAPESDDHDPDVAAFIAASLSSAGGPAGWSKMLSGRAHCLVCGDQFRLENLMICTGCMNYFCGCRAEHRVCHCGGELVG